MHEKILNVEEFLNRVQDDRDLFFELLDIFMEDFHKKRKDLEVALAGRDVVSVEHIAHFLKGSCGNISAGNLRDIFIDLEQRGRSRNVEGTEHVLENIDREFDKLVTRIREIRGKI